MSNDSASVNGVSNSAVSDFNVEKKKPMVEVGTNLKCHRKGITHQEMIENYNAWAKTYDSDLCKGVYNGPAMIAKIVADDYSIEERKTLKVIDVAAGTGKVGEELYSYGFRCIDALEPSKKMLEVAMSRNVYQKSYLEAISPDPNSIKDDFYDCLVMSGGMGEGHIATKSLNELIRIVRPGGAIFIIMREEYISNVSDYAGKLDPYMNELEKKKLWVKRMRQVIPNYSFNKNGVCFVYDVL